MVGVANTPAAHCVRRVVNRDDEGEGYPSSLLPLDKIQQERRAYWAGRYGLVLDPSLAQFFLRLMVTLTMKLATLLIRATITAIWARTAVLWRPRTFGFVRMEEFSFAEAFVLSAANRRLFSP